LVIAGNAFIAYNENRGLGHMPQLTVRSLPEDIVRALRIRAAKNGRSAESEHRLILAQVLQGEATDFWAGATPYGLARGNNAPAAPRCSAKCAKSGDRWR